MGIALWAGCAVVVLFSARSVPFGRPDRWIWELIATLASAIILGLVATSLDFGGWNEPDWRAGLFVAFGSAAVVGLIRLVRLVRTTRPGVGSRGSGVGASNELAPTSARDARSGVGSRESRRPTPAKTPTPHSPLPTPARQQ